MRHTVCYNVYMNELSTLFYDAWLQQPYLIEDDEALEEEARRRNNADTGGCDLCDDLGCDACGARWTPDAVRDDLLELAEDAYWDRRFEEARDDALSS